MTLHEMVFTNYVNGTNAIRCKQENKLIGVIEKLLLFLEVKLEPFKIKKILLMRNFIVHQNGIKMFSERDDME